MSNPKFTEGEWLAKESNGKWFSNHDWMVDNDEMGSYSNVAVHSNGTVIALIVSNENDNDVELEANAHLISAAPDMYQSLKLVLGEIRDGYDSDGYVTINLTEKEVGFIQDAVSKAEGNQNDTNTRSD